MSEAWWRRTFLVPDEQETALATLVRRQPSAVVLGARGHASAIAAALALALARDRRAPCALVCRWEARGEPAREAAPRAEAPPDASPAWRAPAWPAARQLADVLVARGHLAYATGRIVVARLPAEPAEAIAAAARVAAAAHAAPVVVSLSGPRPPALDPLLARQDVVVVAVRGPEEEPLGRLALARLTGAGLAGALCTAAPRMGARTLAVGGLAVSPSLARALDDAVGATR